MKLLTSTVRNPTSPGSVNSRHRFLRYKFIILNSQIGLTFYVQSQNYVNIQINNYFISANRDIPFLSNSYYFVPQILILFKRTSTFIFSAFHQILVVRNVSEDHTRKP